MDAPIKMPLGMNVGLSPGDFVLDGDPVPLPKKRAEPPNFRPMFIVSCRTCVERLYACAQIHYLCFSNFDFGLNILRNPVTFNVTDVICAKNRPLPYRYRNIFLKHRSLSQKRLKPSLGNSSVHRRRNLGTEPSALKILRDKDSAYIFIYVGAYLEDR